MAQKKATFSYYLVDMADWRNLPDPHDIRRRFLFGNDFKREVVGLPKRFKHSIPPIKVLVGAFEPRYHKLERDFDGFDFYGKRVYVARSPEHITVGADWLRQYVPFVYAKFAAALMIDSAAPGQSDSVFWLDTYI